MLSRMVIHSFVEARQAALRWLEEHGHVALPEPDSFLPLIPVEQANDADPAGWRLDQVGFFRSRYTEYDEPHWWVRYWHVDEPEKTGTLRVGENGRIGPGYALFVGCLGLFPPGLFRIEADGTTTSVQSGYGNGPTGEFTRGHDPRYPGWIKQGWTVQYG